MKKTFKLGVIGAGFMAHAIVDGAVVSGAVREKKIIIADKNEDSFEKFSEFDVMTTLDNKTVAENSEYLLLAVKPQNFPEVAESLKGVSVEKVISIMAGVTRYKIRKALGGKAKVCRCMPNLPCSIGAGMAAADMTDFSSSPDDMQFIETLFTSLGEFLPISESKLDAVTGISGSGPAYVYLFIQGLIEAGVANGLDEGEAEALAVQTVIGGAQMVKRTPDKTVDELISAVCSKGGTTIEAMNSFENDNLKGAVLNAVNACVKRSKELSK